jgi:MoxR-like ATPase
LNHAAWPQRIAERESAGDFPTMKPSEISAAIRATYHAQAPLAILGAPGAGKTAVTRQAREQLASELNDPDFREIYLRANLIESVDVTGLPVPDADGDRVKWLRPDFIPQEGTRGLLIIDELPQATMAVQCALMRLVDHLPDGWHVVALGNRVTDRAGAGQLATHVLDRFTHVNFDVSRDDWQKWAQGAGIRPEVRGFIDFRPELLFSFDAAERQKNRAGCSPRSWHRASRILSTSDDAIRHGLLAGTVGDGPAAEFCAFLQVYTQCPLPDAIIAAPETTPVPSDPSALFAVCAALAERAKTLALQQLPALVKYLTRLPIEFGAVLMIDCLALQPQTLTVPGAADWVTRHRDIFATSRK